MKKTLERLNGEKFASYALEAKAMFSIVGATDLSDNPPGTQTGGTTSKLGATTCNLGFSHAGADWVSDQSPLDLDPIKDVSVK
jgi:hypothetical protein